MRPSPVPRVAFFHSTTECQHITLPTAAFVTTGTAALQQHAGPDFHMAVTRTLYVQNSCRAVVWEERRKFDVGSHVGRTFQTCAWRLSLLGPQPRSNPCHRSSGPCALCKVVFSCPTNTHLLRRVFFTEAMCFVSIQHAINLGLAVILFSTILFPLDTSGGGPILPEFRWSRVGVVTTHG